MGPNSTRKLHTGQPASFLNPIMQATFMESVLTTSVIRNMVRCLNLMENLQIYVIWTMVKIQCVIEVYLAQSSRMSQIQIDFLQDFAIKKMSKRWNLMACCDN
jgi:hypothetical protein